jgi:hypothetical protein
VRGKGDEERRASAGGGAEKGRAAALVAPGEEVVAAGPRAGPLPSLVLAVNRTIVADCKTIANALEKLQGNLKACAVALTPAHMARLDALDEGLAVSNAQSAMRTPWATPLPPLSGVRINNCTLSSSSSAIKVEALFQADHGNVSDIAVRGVTIRASNRGVGVW